MFGRLVNQVPASYRNTSSRYILLPEEQEAMRKDFPKSNCKFLQFPRLNKEMKTQIRKTGKDLHYGVKRSLNNLQDQLLDCSYREC